MYMWLCEHASARGLHPPDPYYYYVFTQIYVSFSEWIQEMSPVTRMGSPSISRIIQQFEKTSINSNFQETSFTTQADTDAAVAKINTMFPTASDAHIRLLLKR